MNPRGAGHRRWSTRLRRDAAHALTPLGLAGRAPAKADEGEAEAAPEIGAGSPPEVGDGPARFGNERELLALAAAGDPPAVRWLLDEVAPVVFGFLFARVGGDESRGRGLAPGDAPGGRPGRGSAFRAEASASTWMCAIARRRLARYYESERKAEMARRSLSLVHDGSGAAGPGDDMLERQDEVVRALGRLPALQRQVLVLKYLEDMSVIDIAGQLDRSRVQVQSLLQRGREGLRRELGGQNA